MKGICLAAICFGFFGTISGNAQVTKRKVIETESRASISKKKPPFNGYEFRVKISSDGALHLSVLTGLEGQNLDNASLKTALSDYLAMQTPQVGRKPVGPRVSIDPDINLDFRTVVDVIWAARISSFAAVQIVVPDGPFLNVPPETKNEPLIDLKPNPLTLVAALTKERDVTLNNERLGTMSDLSGMITQLKEVFKQREINGVFRSGTNEVEKTIFIKIPLSASFADLITISRALQVAGANPIGLQVDDLADWTVDTRKELIKIP